MCYLEPGAQWYRSCHAGDVVKMEGSVSANFSQKKRPLIFQAQYSVVYTSSCLVPGRWTLHTNIIFNIKNTLLLAIYNKKMIAKIKTSLLARFNQCVFLQIISPAFNISFYNQIPHSIITKYPILITILNKTFPHLILHPPHFFDFSPPLEDHCIWVISIPNAPRLQKAVAS